MSKPARTAARTTAAMPVAVKIDADQRARAQRLAQARERTPHGQTGEAIAQVVTHEAPREQGHQQALAAWRDDALTGLNVAQARVMALQPGVGRPAEGLDRAFREWPIDFGPSGDRVLYRWGGTRPSFWPCAINGEADD